MSTQALPEYVVTINGVLAAKVMREMIALILSSPAEQRMDYMALSVSFLINAMRDLYGDDFARGFLEASVRQLEEPWVPLPAMRKPH